MFTIHNITPKPLITLSSHWVLNFYEATQSIDPKLELDLT